MSLFAVQSCSCSLYATKHPRHDPPNRQMSLSEKNKRGALLCWRWRSLRPATWSLLHVQKCYPRRLLNQITTFNTGAATSTLTCTKKWYLMHFYVSSMQKQLPRGRRSIQRTFTRSRMEQARYVGETAFLHQTAEQIIPCLREFVDGIIASFRQR